MKVLLKITLLQMTDGVKVLVESMVVSFPDLINGNQDIWLINVVSTVAKMQNQISVQSKNYLHTLLKNYSKIGNNKNNGIDRVALTSEDKKGRDYFIELLPVICCWFD